MPLTKRGNNLLTQWHLISYDTLCSLSLNLQNTTLFCLFLWEKSATYHDVFYSFFLTKWNGKSSSNTNLFPSKAKLSKIYEGEKGEKPKVQRNLLGKVNSNDEWPHFQSRFSITWWSTYIGFPYLLMWVVSFMKIWAQNQENVSAISILLHFKSILFTTSKILEIAILRFWTWIFYFVEPNIFKSYSLLEIKGKN